MFAESEEIYKVIHCGMVQLTISPFMWFFLQGSPQFVILEFSEESQVKEIQIQFQGGFVGKECTVEGGPSSSSLTPFNEFYPEDSNTQQVSFDYFESSASLFFCYIVQLIKCNIH